MSKARIWRAWPNESAFSRFCASSLVKRNLLQVQRQKIGYGAILCSYYYYYYGFTDG